ncbi:unnamed protein product [Trichobilharzia szidati]|nr:unnamed protein product [Trichobilharzia szidati]
MKQDNERGGYFNHTSNFNVSTLLGEDMETSRNKSNHATIHNSTILENNNHEKDMNPVHRSEIFTTDGANQPKNTSSIPCVTSQNNLRQEVNNSSTSVSSVSSTHTNAFHSNAFYNTYDDNLSDNKPVNLSLPVGSVSTIGNDYSHLPVNTFNDIYTDYNGLVMRINEYLQQVSPMTHLFSQWLFTHLLSSDMNSSQSIDNNSHVLNPMNEMTTTDWNSMSTNDTYSENNIQELNSNTIPNRSNSCINEYSSLLTSDPQLFNTCAEESKSLLSKSSLSKNLQTQDSLLVTQRRNMQHRAVFSDVQRRGLESAFRKHAYITKPDRKLLAEHLGLRDAQVKIWFQNRRMKWRNLRQNCKNPSVNTTYYYHCQYEKRRKSSTKKLEKSCFSNLCLNKQLNLTCNNNNNNSNNDSSILSTESETDCMDQGNSVSHQLANIQSTIPTVIRTK